MTPQTRVLLVDDDPLVYRTIATLLAPDGYDVQHAEDGQQALSMIRARQPDVILLDLMMPGLNGFEVCRRIRANPDSAAIPIIVITALSDRHILVEALEAGADEFTTKPVSGIELRARIRTMLRIRRQYIALEDLMQRRDNIMHMVVHDFRSPLTVIASACEMLQMQTEESPRSQTQISRIRDGVARVQRYVDQILLMAKSQNGVLAPILTECSVSSIVQTAIADFEASAARRQLSLINRFPEDIWFRLDEDLVRRAVENLISNAVRYSPPGTAITIAGGLCEEASGTFVEISVADQGRGIPEPERERLFSLYAASGTDQQNNRSVGLGLPFCREVARLHQGDVLVTDNQPVGAVFTLRLGVADDAVTLSGGEPRRSVVSDSRSDVAAGRAGD